MQRKPDINQPKCIRCGKKATKFVSPDLDIRGIPVCNKCHGKVIWDLLALIYEIITEKQFYKLNKFYEKTTN